jgi:hypothetical protein
MQHTKQPPSAPPISHNLAITVKVPASSMHQARVNHQHMEEGGTLPRPLPSPRPGQPDSPTAQLSQGTGFRLCTKGVRPSIRNPQSGRWDTVQPRSTGCNDDSDPLSLRAFCVPKTKQTKTHSTGHPCGGQGHSLCHSADALPRLPVLYMIDGGVL